MSGKAYLNRKPIQSRHCGDLYDTPMSLVWKLLEKEDFNLIYEPAAGNLSIVNALIKDGSYCAQFGDIQTGHDFFQVEGWEGDIITNFPFTNWDRFVIHAKKICKGRVCVLGRLNYLGTCSRSKSGIWDGLKRIYVFNRYPDYRTPYREDGLFHVGGLCTGWFIWEPGYTGPHMWDIMDVNDYAKLGGFKECIS